MNIKVLCMGAMALSMVSGAALAGTLDSPEKMTPFFTDSGMKTMKPDAEFKASWMAMSEEDRTAMSKECSDEGIAKEHNDFCAMTKKLGGAN
ncbi:hypothetical protein [Mesorhizobium sp. LjNodule214]|uniref:hypothetical protein n=1 Tax=Mesorhizobium sp. LjNodule214 TaxID=3342252 RepID=UPI003ECC25A7